MEHTPERTRKAEARMSKPKPEDDGKTQRPTGHYYVRLGEGPEWTPCCWYLRDGFWLVPGRQRPFIDSHFTEIDERRIVREEEKPKFENLDTP